MKFLITGSSGLVGWQVTKDLVKSANQIYSCYHNFKPEAGTVVKMDLTNSENITDVIGRTKPDVVLHLAAITNVDQCEKEQDLAIKVNTKATETISKESAKQDAFLVYVSTDYVFDGERRMQKELDITNPINFYGKSKLGGEKAVISAAKKWCIIRTSTPFGFHPIKRSFPLWIAENLQAKKEISIVTDQFTSPTYIPNLSQMLLEISLRQINGIIHLAGRTRISRFEMAGLVADKLHLDKKLLKPTSINEMKWIAKRPKDSSLDISKANSILKEKPMDVEEGLDHFIKQIKSLVS